MAVVGNNVIVYRDGVAIAGTRSNEVGAIADMIETASPVSGDWKTRRKGRKDWSLNVGYLVISEAGVADLLTIGTEYTLLFKGENDPGVTGKALLQECRFSANLGTLMVGSFSFVGNGPIQVVKTANQRTVRDIVGEDNPENEKLIAMAVSSGTTYDMVQDFDFALIDGESKVLALKMPNNPLMLLADYETILDAIITDYNLL